jgi:hypothetical protein
MPSLFQADIACPHRQSFDRPLFETQTDTVHSPHHAKRNAPIGGHGYPDAVKCRRSKRAAG